MRPIFFMLMVIALSSAPLHAQNLVLNGEFDESLIGWENSGGGPMTSEWIPVDANGSASSGSVEITNLSATADVAVALIQCVPVNSGQKYIIAAKARIPSGPGQSLTNKATLNPRYYSGPDCTIPNGGGVSYGPSPQSFDVWVAQHATTRARAGARSAEVRMFVSKIQAGGTSTAQFDDVSFTSPSIFENGFD